MDLINILFQKKVLRDYITKELAKNKMDECEKFIAECDKYF